MPIDLSNFRTGPLEVEGGADQPLPGGRHSPAVAGIVQNAEHGMPESVRVANGDGETGHAVNNKFRYASGLTGDDRHARHKGLYDTAAVLRDGYMYGAIEIRPAPLNFFGAKIPGHKDPAAPNICCSSSKLVFISGAGGSGGCPNQDAGHVISLPEDYTERIDYVFMAFQPDVLSEIPFGRIDQVDVPNDLCVWGDPEPLSQIPGPPPRLDRNAIVTAEYTRRIDTCSQIMPHDATA